MKKEIKFRVWAKKRKGYRELDQLVFNNQGLEEIWVFPKDDEMQQVYHPSEMVVEQYTGLKDKNGKEIYEGDIVKDDSDRKGKVYFDEGYLAYLFSDPHSWNQWWLRSGLGEYEVIGNVHENTELLEDK